MLLRPPIAAGRFYPDTPAELSAEIARYLGDALVVPAPDETAGIVVPHAGYPFSGPVAAYGFKRVQGKRPGRVVLLGRSHHYGFHGASIITSGALQTPLGHLPVDEDFARKLAREVETESAKAHGPEHALEVELPFLQVLFGEVPVVPILFGCEPGAWHVAFGRSLAARLEPQDLVLVSTDLSHYLSNDQAHDADERSLGALLSGDIDSYEHGVESDAVKMCGATAVVAGMACATARGATQWHLLDYRTSGDVTGMIERVVGYAALSMEYPGDTTP
ncbi:MAG: AmmeMemoRadiSam system protein B [Candidatus Hydrogenedens sp.]|nr:AmmeMemoRadiSam system protein B [Candidatus Hydrogenedens sp.]